MGRKLPQYYAGENVRFVISIAQSRRSAFRPNRAERRMSGFWSRRRGADHRKSTHIGRQSRMSALGKMSSDLGRPIWVRELPRRSVGANVRFDILITRSRRSAPDQAFLSRIAVSRFLLSADGGRRGERLWDIQSMIRAPKIDVRGTPTGSIGAKLTLTRRALSCASMRLRECLRGE